MNHIFNSENPVYNNAGRRKSVYAEPYNPEEDEGADDVKVGNGFVLVGQTVM